MFKSSSDGLGIDFLKWLIIAILPCSLLGRWTTESDSSSTTIFSKFLPIENPLRAQDYHIKLSYWNDNFGYQGAIREIIPPGKDDGVTAAFRLQYGQYHQNQMTDLDLYYAILTNRKENYRMDLIALRVTNERKLKWGNLLLGAGFIGQGNFGGATIQNWYHKVKGYTQVDLDYLDGSAVGFTATGRVLKNIWEYDKTTASIFAGTSLRTGTSASYLRGGMIINQSFMLPPLKLPGRIQLMSSIFHYFPSMDVFDPLFQEGVMVGGMISLNVIPHGVVSGWMTLNQYGLNNPHYGMTLAYQSKTFHPGNLRGFLFP